MIPTFGLIEGEFAKHLIGKTFTIIQGHEVQVGDTLVDFQHYNFAHQVPAKITKAKIHGQFIHIKWKGRDGDVGRQYATTCLFGRLVEP